MKNIKIDYLKVAFLSAFISILNVSCQRNLSDDAVLSTYSKNGEVFIDGFSAGLGYGAFGGSKYSAFTVDKEVKYAGTASMRFDVPSVGDPNGAYAGGVFIDGTGRNLTDYDALTFWVKGSQAATLNEVGFGTDFGDNKYKVTFQNVPIDTNWKKIIIPIPDASKLIQEKGMFWYSEGSENDKGYTFWIDNVKYEKLGTIAHPNPVILNGTDKTEQTFIGSNITVSGLEETFNMDSGANLTISVAPSYYTFTSSDKTVATVNELGVISVIGSGTSLIKATLGNVQAKGSLKLTSVGNLPPAPKPSQLQSNVKSIFSDWYIEATPVNTDPRFGGSTTSTSLLTVTQDSFLSYTNNNYTGILFENKIDASDLTSMHVDVYAQQAGVQLEFQIRDVGANGVLDTNVNTGQPILDDKDFRFTASNLTVNAWNQINIPLIGNITNQKNNLKAIILVGGPNFILDNIYFYGVPTAATAPTTAAPNPTVAAANVISVFSDAYTNIAGTNLNPGWGQATVVTQTPIAGNNTLKYAGLNYQGIQLGTAQNVSGMTHLHIDYYSSNSTALNAYLISTGPVDKAKALTVPTTSGWVSLEIPLSNFSPVNLADIIQLKFDGNGTIYLDNIYFHN